MKFKDGKGTLFELYFDIVSPSVPDMSPGADTFILSGEDDPRAKNSPFYYRTSLGNCRMEEPEISPISQNQFFLYLCV